MPAIRVAVVGYGLAGRVFHAPLVAAAGGLTLRFVVTGNADRAVQAERDHPGVDVLPTADVLLGRADEWDVMVVATTNAAHVPLALAGIGLGKAVVVDKPLASSAAEAEQLVVAAAAACALLTVFQNRRWDSDQRTLDRLLAEGVLGEVLRYESRFERWRPEPRPGSWRETLPAAQGGGQLLDLGAHLVDQALHRFGPAAWVYGEVDARRGASDDDAFVAIEHVSGVRSHLWAGAMAGSPGPRLRVSGSRGAYVVEGLDGQEDALRVTGRAAVGGFVEPEGAWGRLVRGDEVRRVPSEPGRWDLFYPAVAAAVRDEAPVPVDPADAVAALRVIEAARTSAAEHRVVAVA